MANLLDSYPKPFGRYEQEIWTGDPGAYGGKRARRPFAFDAFIPERIAGRSFPFTGETTAGILDATLAVAHLNQSSVAPRGLEALATQLLRSEALASSRIEGLDLSHRRLARASFDGSATHDLRAAEVVGNVQAMRKAITLGEAARPLRIADIAEIHRALLTSVHDERVAGTIRTTQNWIGTNPTSPAGAHFVPPPARHVRGLMEDLCEFVERTDLPELAQAAIAHAQFETIHPFGDGNGRVGRCLVHFILRRRGVAPRYVPPISLVLARDRPRYIAGLTAYREGEIDGWCDVFCQSANEAATLAEDFARHIDALQDEWLQRAGKPRANSTARTIIEHLAEHPVLDGPAVQRLAGCSDVAALRALNRLQDAGVLIRVDDRRRNRTWECRELLDRLHAFEHDLVT
jgi:Fic family protein